MAAFSQMAAFILPFVEHGFVRLFVGVAFAPRPRSDCGCGDSPASGQQQDPTSVADHGCLNSMMDEG
jgi:hypothetical protein